MRWPRWLVRLVPRLAPQGTWGDAVRVTDPMRLADLDTIYAEQVAWCGARNIPILAPERLITFRVWPEALRPPDGLGLAKVLAPSVIAGDWHGTLLIRERWKDNADILAHECRHAITGQSGHPDWLFSNG